MRTSAVVCGTAILLLTACSGSHPKPGPSAADFSPGTCRDASPAVLAIQRDASALGRRAPSADLLAKLTRSQDALRATLGGPMRPGAPRATGTPSAASDPAVAQAVRSLSQAVGLLRLRVAGNQYGPDLATGLTTAYHQVLVACDVKAPGS